VGVEGLVGKTKGFLREGCTHRMEYLQTCMFGPRSYSDFGHVVVNMCGCKVPMLVVWCCSTAAAMTDNLACTRSSGPGTRSAFAYNFLRSGAVANLIAW
jgi:hypothetical protein